MRSGGEAQAVETVLYVTTAESAYLAGLMDGEGSVDVVNKSFNPRLKIEMTDESTIQWIHTNFGGRVYKTKGTKLPAWRWNAVRQADVRAVIEAILPYLILKRDRCLAARDLLDELRQPGRDVDRLAELAERCTYRYWRNEAQPQGQDLLADTPDAQADEPKADGVDPDNSKSHQEVLTYR